MRQSRDDAGTPSLARAPFTPMSDERPARTIYRSSGTAAASHSNGRRDRRAGAGAADSAAPAPARPRERLRDAWWLAPLLALAIVVVVVVATGFFVLGGSGLLRYVGISLGGHQFQGSWGAAGTTIGGPVVHIARQGGNRYVIQGLRFPDLAGAGSVEAQVQDDSLVATGSNGAPWHLSLTFINRDQLRADLTYGDGGGARRIVLTRL